MQCLVLFTFCFGLAVPLLAQSSSDPLDDPHWKAWKSFYGKNYGDFAEERIRNFIWQDNLKKITSDNEVHNNYKLAMNHLGDLTSQEVKQMLNGFKGTMNSLNSLKEETTFLPPPNIKLPESVDWRKLGYVTNVKNQHLCESSWAFSATGSLEAQHAKKSGSLVSLSAQNLVDCSRLNHGCRGGLMGEAFIDIKNNGGIDTEESYPYHAKESRCQFNISNVGATVTGFVKVSRSEYSLQVATVVVGPISVAIDASQSSFRFYSHGVYDDPLCSNQTLNHAVLVVGYGIERGQDYWLVKNSWSTWWGEKGYVKIARNDNNICGITNYAVYPLV